RRSKVTGQLTSGSGALQPFGEPGELARHRVEPVGDRVVALARLLLERAEALDELALLGLARARALRPRLALGARRLEVADRLAELVGERHAGEQQQLRLADPAEALGELAHLEVDVAPQRGDVFLLAVVATDRVAL